MRIQYVILFALLGAFAQRGDDTSYDFNSNKCTCDCGCALPEPCKLEFIVVLDAAGCVAEAWGGMKLRMDELARRVDKIYKIGDRSRFSVITYSDEALVEIDSASSYSDFSRQLTELKYKERGSFLDKAISKLHDHYDSNDHNGFDTVVVLITNGKSDDSVDNDSLAQEIERFAGKINGQFYVNTIHKLASRNSFEMADNDCTACDYNQALFSNAGVPNDQVISKDDILYDFMSKSSILGFCSDRSIPVCQKCDCECEEREIETIPAPAPLQGVRGDVGFEGPVGESGDHGKCGRKGAQGPPGANGEDGLHGVSATFGEDGEHGDRGKCGPIGIRGPQGAPGPEGPPGEKGEIGFPGAVGEQGKISETGAPGEQGPRGFLGPKGRCGVC